MSFWTRVSLLAIVSVAVVAVALLGSLATPADAAVDEGVVLGQEQVLFATSVNDPAHVPLIAAAITVTVTDDEVTFDGTGADLVPPFGETIIEVVTVEDELGQEVQIATITTTIDGTPPVPPSADVAITGVTDVNDNVYVNTGIFSTLDVWFVTTVLVAAIPLLVLLTVIRTRLLRTAARIQEVSTSISRQLSHHGLLAVALVALVAVAVAVAQYSTSGRAGSFGLFTWEAVFSIALVGLVLLTLLGRLRWMMNSIHRLIPNVRLAERAKTGYVRYPRRQGLRSG